MHKFSVCACISQDFAQSKKIFVRMHDRSTLTFRNSENTQHTKKTYTLLKANTKIAEFDLKKKLCVIHFT